MSSAPPVRVAVLSAARTPIGRFGGAVRSTSPVVLGTVAARGALGRAGVAPNEVDEVLIGQGIQGGHGQNPARQVLRGVGIPDSVGAATINMVCGSGMKALHLGYLGIRAGAYSIVLVGGMESMSTSSYYLSGEARWGLRYGHRTLVDGLRRDALEDAYGEHEVMGFTGERIARKFHLTRAELDRFSLRSHERALAAARDGRSAQEIVGVPGDSTARGQPFEVDEGPRPDTSLAKLAALPPAFAPDGLLTAGNSSPLSDGAAALVLASESVVKQRGVSPLAWIHSVAESGVHPDDVMEAPIPTVRRHLEAVGLTPAAFDRVEHNEAFSSASIAVQRTFGWSDDVFNVRGGAVALGHPIGASGARIVVTLAHELAHARRRRGLATLCMGGGNGLSVILERSDS